MQESQSVPDDDPSPREALGQCRRCLAALLERIQALLADTRAQTETANAPLPDRARILCGDLDASLELHIADEESDVFPAVLAAADSQARRAQAFELVSELLVEHREMTQSWHALRQSLLAALAGESPAIPEKETTDFIDRLRAHLEREEVELGDLMGMIGSAQSRDMAVPIARRHEEACSRITSCQFRH